MASGITKPKSGVRRYLQRLFWSVRKRTRAQTPLRIAFDQTLVIEVNPQDRLGRRILLNGYSEPELALFLDAYLQPDMVFFDIGAHFGQYSLVAARRVGSGGKVHAFEPTAATFRQLLRNIEINQLSWISANHNAVYEKNCELELQVCVNGKGEFNSLGKPMRPEQEIVGSESVTALTLDAYCAGRGIQYIDLIKIDVEGAELQVLRGAKDLLAGEYAPDIICEFNPRTMTAMGYGTRQLRDQFHSLGYRLYYFDQNSLALDEARIDANYHGEQGWNIVATKDPDLVFSRLTTARRH